jgi:hypothetical protein
MSINQECSDVNDSRTYNNVFERTQKRIKTGKMRDKKKTNEIYVVMRRK